MTGIRKTWLVAAAAWPGLYLVLVLVTVPFLKPLGIVASTPPSDLPLWFRALLWLHATTAVVAAIVLVACLVYLFRHSALSGRRRALWAALLILGSLVTTPFFVWRHVGNREGDSRSAARCRRRQRPGADDTYVSLRGRRLRRTFPGAAALVAVVLVLAVARLKPPAVKPSTHRDTEKPLAHARASTGWTLAWDVSVSATGLVRIHSDPAGRFVETRTLSTAELAALLARLEEEQPLELPSDLGEPVVDGPERVMEFDVAGRHARIALMHTPGGLTRKMLENSRLDLPRAIRLCEAIRALAHDDSLRSCIDGPLSTQRKTDQATAAP